MSLNREELTEVYDFVEIGTADFETLIQACPEESRGLSIEPLSVYLDRLPNKKNVTKVNAAIVTDEEVDEVEIYHVTEDVIRIMGFGTWLKGCNSVGKPHDFHLNYYPDPRAWHEGNHFPWNPVNLLEKGYVNVDKVPALTFKKLVEKFKIKHIKFLKTDTEGFDPSILNAMLDFYDDNSMLSNLPPTIYFEWNKHCKEEELEQIKERLEKYGYEVGLKNAEDIHNRVAVLKTKDKENDNV
tara:strand:- start:1369 stop:2091 length:723 start_codon:yes stop_codon:yes gene_type:complete